MKLYSIMICKWQEGKTPIIISNAVDLSAFSIFTRGTAQEVLFFVNREVVQRCRLGSRESILHQGHLCHALIRSDGISCSVISDEEYPQRVAFTLINKALDAFAKAGVPEETWREIQKDTNIKIPVLNELLQKFQDPQTADPVENMKKDLEETKVVLIKSIDQLLARGEKLDVLVGKSDQLSFQSKVFLEKSEDLNKCCIII